jgi:NAD(P)-dependent dehydrogenase (short-subunit alcohol dehydrogenase family)
MTGVRTWTALVTGGTGGMGRVIAAGLAADGFDVAVAYAVSIDMADATIGKIKGHGRHGAAFAADIADSGAVAALFGAAEDHFGHLDVVVHDQRAVHPAGARTALIAAAGPRADRTARVHGHDGTPVSTRQHEHRSLGTRRPIPRAIASNDIVATHSAVWVASLDATAAALARHGTPLTDDELMVLRGGIRAALVAGADGYRFLMEEQTVIRYLVGSKWPSSVVRPKCQAPTGQPTSRPLTGL